MLRDGLTPLGIVLDQRGIKGDLMGNKDQEVVEQFQGLLRWKAASQPQESQLVGEAQPVMRAATLGDLGLVGGGKADAVGDKVARIVHRMEHGRVLLRRGLLGHGHGAPEGADVLMAQGPQMRDGMMLHTIEQGA
jgi:hypothetical protein